MMLNRMSQYNNKNLAFFPLSKELLGLKSHFYTSFHHFFLNKVVITQDQGFIFIFIFFCFSHRLDAVCGCRHLGVTCDCHHLGAAFVYHCHGAAFLLFV